MFFGFLVVRNHRHPKQVIVSKGKKVLGFHFCEHAPNCDICSFLHQQVSIITLPTWLDGQAISYCSLMVEIVPENPYILSEHVRLYLSDVFGFLPKSALQSLRRNELALSLQFPSRTDWKEGFFMKVNLFMKEALPNELIQELGLHFFLNNLTNREVHAEFGVIDKFDIHSTTVKVKEGSAIINVYGLPVSYHRDYSFMVQSGIQPVFLGGNGRVSSPIFDWILEYS